MPFSYDAITGVAATGTATITVRCDSASDTPIVISLGSGLGGDGTAAGWRILSGATSRPRYNLYVDSAHSSVWGDGTDGTVTQSHAQVPGTFTFTIYGLIPAHQRIEAGSLVDTISVTMSY